MKFTLERDPIPTPSYTYGVMRVAGLVLQTMERPWVPDPRGGVGGHPDISCVPLGEYQLMMHDSMKHPKTWALVNTALGIYHMPGDIPEEIPDGRWGCLIHPADLAYQLAGCIAPGMIRWAQDGVPDVEQSKVAFMKIKFMVPWTEGHTLTISTFGAGT